MIMNTKKMVLVRFLFQLIPASSLYDFKIFLLRWAGVSVGNNVRIMSSVKIYGDMELSIGDDVFIGHDSMIMGNKGSSITLEDHCVIGSRVVILQVFIK